MYGQDKYGVTKYAGNGQSGQYEDEYFQDLSGYVPDYLRDKREIKALTTAEGYEIGLAFHNLRDVFDQAFLSTATWGLSLWERDNGITTNLSLSYEERKEIIAAKLRGSGTVTGRMLKNTAEAFSGGDVEIIEKPEEYLFIIRFVGMKGIPRNMQAFMAMLDDIKPAHLAYKFEYTYTTWNSLKIFTWGELAEKTWDEVRVMREVEYTNETWKSMGLYTWNMVYWKTWEEIK